MNNSIETRPINLLLGEKFFIPKYQRGYRWGAKEVKDLLNDILEFQENAEKDEFYCLQPIVLKQREEDWEVIDGQQRLTTIYIILNFFNSRFADDFKKELYDLTYATRPKSEAFLKNLSSKISYENIDFHFISLAYGVVKDWFKSRMNLVNDFESALLNKVKVIWYEIKDDEKAVDIFTRINVGKIPLTNAELIKALFLRRKNFVNQNPEEIRLHQLKISGEWDSMESRLQEDDFWYFLYGKEGNYSTRIEFIFDLIKGKKESDDEFYTFFQYSNDGLENDEKKLYTAWSDIKTTYLRLIEWFEDREFYHLIGYLVHTGTNLKLLLDQAEGRSKTAFKDFISDLIKEKVSYNLNVVSYADSKAVRNILLLFNIQTILNNPSSNIRFAFDDFKKESWDIEHIRSQNSEMPKTNKRERWLEDILEYLNNPHSANEHIQNQIKSLRKKANNLISKKDFDSERFEKIYSEIMKLFKEDEEEDFVHGLGNLALLDAKTNRGYKNVIFPLKRSTIISNDKKGEFVPICTKNVFLKYYTKNPNELIFWQQQDAEDYLTEIENILEPYLKRTEIYDY